MVFANIATLGHSKKVLRIWDFTAVYLKFKLITLKLHPITNEIVTRHLQNDANCDSTFIGSLQTICSSRSDLGINDSIRDIYSNNTNCDNILRDQQQKQDDGLSKIRLLLTNYTIRSIRELNEELLAFEIIPSIPPLI